jgi:hypothetical protein
VNQQGGDVTEGEGCHDRDERLLVELARLWPSLLSAPSWLLVAARMRRTTE